MRANQTFTVTGLYLACFTLPARPIKVSLWCKGKMPGFWLLMIPTINNNPEKYGTGKKTARGKALGDAF